MNTNLGQIIDAVMGNILTFHDGGPYRKETSFYMDWFLYDWELNNERVNNIFWVIRSTAP